MKHIHLVPGLSENLDHMLQRRDSSRRLFPHRSKRLHLRQVDLLHFSILRLPPFPQLPLPSKSISFFLSFLVYSEPQPPPHALPHNALKFGSPLPPHLGGLNIGRTLVVRLREHTHDADEDLFRALDGTPALTGLFVVVGVVPRGMQDAYADLAVGVYVGVEDFA